MKVRRSALVSLVALTALALPACGDDAPDDLAFVDTTTTTLIAGPPDVELSDAEAELVAFEADWVCELQRRTFASPEEQDAALSDNLAYEDLERADYDAFRAEVNQRQDLRDAILYAYQEGCRA